MQAVEKVLLDAWRDPVLQQAANQPDLPFSHEYDESQDREYQPRPPKAARVPTPIPLIMCMDAAVGLLNHLSTHQHSKQIILRRRIAEDILLPMVMEADTIDCPPEQFLCKYLSLCVVFLLVWWCVGVLHEGIISMFTVVMQCVCLSSSSQYKLCAYMNRYPGGGSGSAHQVDLGRRNSSVPSPQFRIAHYSLDVGVRAGWCHVGRHHLVASQQGAGTEQAVSCRRY